MQNGILFKHPNEVGRLRKQNHRHKPPSMGKLIKDGDRRLFKKKKKKGNMYLNQIMSNKQ